MGDIVGSAFSLSETLGVSRTVQQLLQRHRSRLSVTSAPSNGTQVTGVHQPRTDSECESESETESRLRCNQVQCTTGSRPDPIGSSDTYDGATFERDSNPSCAARVYVRKSSQRNFGVKIAVPITRDLHLAFRSSVRIR